MLFTNGQYHSQSKNYFTTDGLSASLSWYQEQSGARDQFFFSFHGNYYQSFASFYYWAPSLMTGLACSLQLEASPAQSFSGLSSVALIIILYCLNFESGQNWRVTAISVLYVNTFL
jgi:hypothetical protein